MHPRKRRFGFECLEDRVLLTVTPAELDAIRSSYGNFEIASDVNVIEIQASQLSVASLKNAIQQAKASGLRDDLIVLRTTDNNHDILFKNASDELVFDTPVEEYGIITFIAKGTQPLTLNAAALSRVLAVRTGHVQLGNMTMTGGRALTDPNGTLAKAGCGGAIANCGELYLQNVTVSDNWADCGIFDDSNNSFNSKGGGIYNDGQLYIYDSLVSSNTARSGQANSSNLAAYGAGGGIFNHTGAQLQIYNTRILGNTAQSDTIRIVPTESGGSAVVITVEQYGIGGGIFNYGATCISTKSAISENYAYTGGGIASLYDLGASNVSVVGTRITSNNAKESGGGIYSAPRCVLSVDSCEILDNHALKLGGGITNRSQFDMVNSVVSGNTAGEKGGGLYSYGSWSPTIPVFTVNATNVTMTGNSAPSGAGIHFTGIRNSDTFATMTLSNSIIVNNKPVTGTVPEDDSNISVLGTCSGFHALSTFQNWTSGNDNVLYDAMIPLFLRDYDFVAKTHGDYRLAYGVYSQAIDRGDNAIAQAVGLDATAFDVAGQARIKNNTIDLGAHEYQPTPFDPAFPSQLSVQQGCSFNLTCEGSDTHGSKFVRYWIDLNGDGQFDLSGPDIWLSVNDLVCLSSARDKGYFWLAVENAMGEVSQTKQTTVNIADVPPSIYVTSSTKVKGQLLKLALRAKYPDRTVKQWIIDWGDGSKPAQYDYISTSCTTTHYYAPQASTKTFTITLTLVDTYDKGRDTVYYIASHTVKASTSAVMTNAVSTVCEELPALIEVVLEPDVSQQVAVSSQIITQGRRETVLANDQIKRIAIAPQVAKVLYCPAYQTRANTQLSASEEMILDNQERVYHAVKSVAIKKDNATDMFFNSFDDDYFDPLTYPIY